MAWPARLPRRPGKTSFLKGRAMSVDETSSGNATQPGPSPRAWLRLLGAWLLAVGLLIVVAWPVIATVNPETFATTFDLSKRAKAYIKSAYPDIEASADGKYVATVWSRGYNAANNTKDYGYVMLKSAITGTGTALDGWENQVKVFTPTAELWGLSPRAVFDPNDSGKLYVTWVGCDVLSTDPSLILQCDTIMAATCTVSGADACSVLPTVYSAGSSELRSPDIAADKNGQLHVVWRNHTAGKIQYSHYDGSWSTTPADVAVDGSGNVFYNPALVWGSGPSGNGRLHLAVYQFNSNTGSRFVQYRTDTNPSNDAWDAGTTFSWKAPSLYKLPGDSSSGTAEPYVKPSIAATGTDVYIAWEVKLASADKFHLAYDCSTTSGTSWQNSSLEGLPIPGPFFTDTTAYLSPISSIDEEDALRPSIAISGTSPAVAWHFKGTETDPGIAAYLIAFRDSTGSCGSLTWGERAVISQSINYDLTNGDDDDDSADPDLAMAPGSGVHIAHMGMWGVLEAGGTSADWDIYYRGDIKTDNSTDDVGGAYLPIIIKK
jgi:hypothetical protein